MKQESIPKFANERAGRIPARQGQAQIEARDIEALNRAAEDLAPEIEDVLRYQAEVEDL